MMCLVYLVHSALWEMPLTTTVNGICFKREFVND